MEFYNNNKFFSINTDKLSETDTFIFEIDNESTALLINLVKLYREMEKVKAFNNFSIITFNTQYYGNE